MWDKELTMPTMTEDLPEVGQLVRARGQQWLVAAVSRTRQPADELSPSCLPGQTIVTLTSVADDDLGEELRVVWEIEPGRQILAGSALPQLGESNWDDPQRLGAFIDAVRWGTVASADELHRRIGSTQRGDMLGNREPEHQPFRVERLKTHTVRKNCPICGDWEGVSREMVESGDIEFVCNARHPRTNSEYRWRENSGQ